MKVKTLTKEEISEIIKMVKLAEDKSPAVNRTLYKKLSKKFNSFYLNFNEKILEINGIRYEF